MTHPAADAKQSANLIAALLDNYEELQNLVHLVRGASMVVDAADFSEKNEKFAVEEILVAIQRRVGGIVEAIQAANSLDVDAMIGRRDAKSPTPESHPAKGRSA